MTLAEDVLQAPFPYFGGKSRAAPLVWERFGEVPNFVEPFFGSGAVLLGRPHEPKVETVNDKDGFVANFFRAVRHDPEQTAYYADWPVNESDLHARHIWLVQRRDELTAHLEGDPDYYDAKIAGYWCWGICCWIGSGWCSGEGPWTSVDGRLVRRDGNGGEACKKRPHLGDAGQGVNRKLAHLGDAGRGVNRRNEGIYAWFEALAARLRYVRVCCGDWTRVLGPSPTTKLGLTGVFVDPPYSEEERKSGLYAVDDGTVAARVREWAIRHGDDPQLRIALCGYVGEHDMPDGWTAVRWKAAGGYGSQGKGRGRENAVREVIWFSRYCLKPEQQQVSMWDFLPLDA